MSTGKSERLIFDSKLKGEKDYWIQKLSGALGESNLRLDYERPTGEQGPCDTLNVSVPKTVYEKLVGVTGDVDLLTYTFLMAALKVCLWKYTGSDSIVVGSPATRNEDEPPKPANA